MGNFFEGLLKISVICSGIILLIALVSPLLKKGHTVFWRYILWIVLGIRLALPFDFSISEYAFLLPALDTQQRNVDIQKEHGNVQKPAATQDLVLDDSVKKISGESSGKKASEEVVYKGFSATGDEIGKKYVDMPSDNKVGKENIYQLLACIWAVVTVFLFLVQVGSYWIFCRKLRKTKSFLWKKENIPVFTSAIVHSPMLVGICRPQIILPMQHYTEEQVGFIVSHEYAHYKRKDLAVKLLLAWGKTLHWFNPFVHYMERRAGKDIELLCDSQVVGNFTKEEKKQYGQMLLTCASGHKKGDSWLCVGHFSERTHTLKERFSNLCANAGRKKGIVAAIAGIGVVLSASLFLSFGMKEKLSLSVQEGDNGPQQEGPADLNPIGLEGTDKEIKMPELPLEKAANKRYGATLPHVIFASSERVILNDYWGMMVYNVKERKIGQILDLPALDLNHIQGSTVTKVEVSEDGSQVLLYNWPDTEERYLYDIEQKKLVHTQQEHLGHIYQDVVWGEDQYAILNTTEIAYLSLNSLKTKKEKVFHGNDMMGLSLVIKNTDSEEVRVYPLFKEYYEAQGKTAVAYYRYQDLKRQVISEKYLYGDEEGWEYYLEQDKGKESRIQKFAPTLDPLLLVRRKDGERQVLEDLLIPEMVSWCPVLFVDGRIIYQAAPEADLGGVKDPVLVSIALDGSDRKTADDILYHDFDHLCEDQGWIYYAGWTNDNGFPQPLCRIPADFHTAPQFVQNIPGRLVGVEDGAAYYLTDRSKQPGIYWCDLKTGKEQLYDKWGIVADELSFFNSQESRSIPNGEKETVPWSHLVFSYGDLDEMYTTNIQLKNKHCLFGK